MTTLDNTWKRMRWFAVAVVIALSIMTSMTTRVSAATLSPSTQANAQSNPQASGLQRGTWTITTIWGTHHIRFTYQRSGGYEGRYTDVPGNDSTFTAHQYTAGSRGTVFSMVQRGGGYSAVYAGWLTADRQFIGTLWDVDGNTSYFELSR